MNFRNASDPELLNFYRYASLRPRPRRAGLYLLVYWKAAVMLIKRSYQAFSRGLRMKRKIECRNSGYCTRNTLSLLKSGQSLDGLGDTFRLATCNISVDELFGAEMSFNDAEDFHAYFRLRFLPHIVHADEKKAKEILGLLPDWLTSKKRNAYFSNPYTTSERIVHLIWSISILNSARNSSSECPDWFKRLCSTTCDQVDYLMENIEFHLGHHNHLINNARALLSAAVVFSNHKHAKKWRLEAIRIVRSEWPIQLLQDGVHAEQSLTYHLLLTRTLWELKELFKEVNEQFPFEKDLQKMIFYAVVMVRPDGTIPFLGHITPDWHWSELVGLLPIWGSPIVKTSSLGKLYKEGSKVVEDVNETGFIFPYAGQGIIRGRDFHVVLCSDPRGILTCHGDQNQLGLDVWLLGAHLIRDCGLDSYNNGPDRSWFESSGGQSSFTIDGVEPVVSNWRRRQLPESYCNSGGAIWANYEARTVHASHTGYHRLPDPVDVSRSVQVLDNNVVVIVDEANGRDSHSYLACFHFGALLIVCTKDNSIELFDSRINQRFVFSWSGESQCEAVKRNYAESYGSKVVGNSCLFRTTFSKHLRVEYTIKAC